MNARTVARTAGPFLAALLAVVAASGCGRKPPTDAEFGLPDDSAQARAGREGALLDGVSAMMAFRREGLRASVEESAPNYAPARAQLAAAIARLRPAPGKMPAPQLEACIPPMQSALAAMDQVIAAGKAGDPVAAREGWTGFSQSVETLFMLLKPAEPGGEDQKAEDRSKKAETPE